MNAKPIIIILGAVSLIVGAVIFFNLDDTMAKKQYQIDGVFVSEMDSGRQGSAGFETQRYFVFKLSDGNMAQIDVPYSRLMEENKHIAGDKATVYYRKGHFTSRAIYDHFEFQDRR